MGERWYNPKSRAWDHNQRPPEVSTNIWRDFKPSERKQWRADAFREDPARQRRLMGPATCCPLGVPGM
eukprot:3321364-Lingulodinium_polyedra.AAC.1